jgi:hypothetical protein
MKPNKRSSSERIYDDVSVGWLSKVSDRGKDSYRQKDVDQGSPSILYDLNQTARDETRGRRARRLDDVATAVINRRYSLFNFPIMIRLHIAPADDERWCTS